MAYQEKFTGCFSPNLQPGKTHHFLIQFIDFNSLFVTPQQESQVKRIAGSGSSINETNGFKQNILGKL